MQPETSPLTIQDIDLRIITIRDQKIMLDREVAEVYGVETKRINEAVKNNPDRFPAGYVFELTESETNKLVENFDRFQPLKHSAVCPKAFTEKGLYMLATILKSKSAVQTTLAIIETFTKVRELTNTVRELAANPDKESQNKLMGRSGEIMADLLGDHLQTTDTETTFEINFAVMKFKHIVKRK
ncbi:MAG: ORF6N domain-containing protein [Bacteroidales bacterium]|nr:ORF6N domain-containing protein [Bacteroidales bacterium]